MLTKLCKKEISRLQRLLERDGTEEEMKREDTGKALFAVFLFFISA